jgi:Zn-dependent protease with chaperone function
MSYAGGLIRNNAESMADELDADKAGAETASPEAMTGFLLHGLSNLEEFVNDSGMIERTHATDHPTISHRAKALGCKIERADDGKSFVARCTTSSEEQQDLAK